MVQGPGNRGLRASRLRYERTTGHITPRRSNPLNGRRPGTQGANTSGLSIADSTGSAWALAVTGLVFTATPGLDGPFAATLAFTTLLAVGAALVAPRVASRTAQPVTDASTART